MEKLARTALLFSTPGAGSQGDFVLVLLGFGLYQAYAGRAVLNTNGMKVWEASHIHGTERDFWLTSEPGCYSGLCSSGARLPRGASQHKDLAGRGEQCSCQLLLIRITAAGIREVDWEEKLVFGWSEIIVGHVRPWFLSLTGDSKGTKDHQGATSFFGRWVEFCGRVASSWLPGRMR